MKNYWSVFIKRKFHIRVEIIYFTHTHYTIYTQVKNFL